VRELVRVDFLECITNCGVEIFDESHTAKSRVTQTFESLMKIDVPCGIPLTGTPIHLTVGDWVVQPKWLFTQVTDHDQFDSHSPRPLDSGIAQAMRENITLEEAYDHIKDIAWLWTIRHWEETKYAKGELVVRIPKVVQHDLRLQDTDNKATATDGWIEDTKGDKCNAIQTILHAWRLS